MEREFTNALCNTPLWSFALSVYPQYQSRLLSLQDDHGANVNRLLAYAFADSGHYELPDTVLNAPRMRRLEALIMRVRRIRRQSSEEPGRSELKRFELELEGLHLILLNSAMQPVTAESASRAMQRSADAYEKQLGIKKGTLVPFIRQLKPD